MEFSLSEYELLQRFSLTEAEKGNLPTHPDQSRLGFAILFKFLQVYGKFPKSQGEVPDFITGYLAKQIGVDPKIYREYSWEGRTIERHRAQIRLLLDFHENSFEDRQKLSEWLAKYLDLNDTERLEDIAYEHLYELKIEPPAPEVVQRIVYAAIQTHEDRLYATIYGQLSDETRKKLDALLDTTPDEQRKEANKIDSQWEVSDFAVIRKDSGPVGLESVLSEVAKLEKIRNLKLPLDLFQKIPHKTIQSYHQRTLTEPLRELRRHPEATRQTLISAFCWIRSREIIDNLVDLIILVVHRISIRAENKVIKELIQDAPKVYGKNRMLYQVAEASLSEPKGVVEKVIFPVVGEQTLKNLVKEYKFSGSAYQIHVQKCMKSSYSHHYRRMLPKILTSLEFRSNNDIYRPVIKALELLKRYAGSRIALYPVEESVPLNEIVLNTWEEFVIKQEDNGKDRVYRIPYEICVLQALRNRLRTKEIWVVGADRFRNPDEDLPTDFSNKREAYYKALNQPIDNEIFVAKIQDSMKDKLKTINDGLPNNSKVEIIVKKKSHIKLSPLTPQSPPPNIRYLKKEISDRWPMTSLLDILKETDLRVSFSQYFQSFSDREGLDAALLQKRLLLCLYGLGTNLGLKRISAGDHGEKYDHLYYVRQRFIHKSALRQAIAHIVNELLAVRLSHIWGKATTTCASDSKKFGAWDQNLMTEWHVRYHGRGIMIYWHVERKAACIYSQLRRCSSSEVAAMIEGVLRHCTEMEVDRQYVDSHGQSHVAFAFCYLLGFLLLPRLKGIHKQKLNRPYPGEPDAYPNIKEILTRPINWELIKQQYDEMIKYTTALRLGTAEAEAILRRFTRDNPKHPTYLALVELGRAVKTIFLCEYLHSEKLRQEIQEGLNMIELWNGVNDFIFYGRSGEISSNRRDDQETSMLCLHLLQNCLVYINTLMIQQVLSEPQWQNRLTPEDLRALTPLFYAHVNPYGNFHLDMNERIPL